MSSRDVSLHMLVKNCDALIATKGEGACVQHHL